MLEEQRLDKRIHDYAEFDCGVPGLNEYLHRYAMQDRRRLLSQIHVLLRRGEPNKIVGYYTLSAAQVDVKELADSERSRLPRYPIPCFRMGRLAVHREYQNAGYGKAILGCAVRRCLQAGKEIAAYALIVDALDDSAKSFYEHYGFIPFADEPLSLYLSLGKQDR